MNRSLLLSVSLVVVALFGGAPALAGEVGASGSTPDALRIVVYEDFEPFSERSQGIDVELGKLLSESLGRRPEIVSVKASEDVNKDLRNMIGKGHHTVTIPLAHVMMHVPVDRMVGGRYTGAVVFAPYFREKYALLRNPDVIPEYQDATVFKGHKVGVEADSLPQSFLLTEVGQANAANVVQFRTVPDAVQALQNGEVAAVMATRAELEGLVGRSPKHLALSDLHEEGLMRVPAWNVGLAVKSDDEQLRDELSRAIDHIRASGDLERLFEQRGISYVAPRPAIANP